MKPLLTRCVGVGRATGVSPGGAPRDGEDGHALPEGAAVGEATGVTGRAGVWRNRGDAGRAKSAFAVAGSPAMRITAPHTSQRARIPPVGTFAGSIR